MNVSRDPVGVSVELFDFNGMQVRTVVKEGEPWFVAADIAAVLDIANVRTSLALLDEDEKGVHSMDTPGGTQDLSVINESGLYSLVLRSRKPEAKRFKKWVTSEVLPAIRKHGGYLSPAAVEQSLTDPDFIIRLATQLKAEQAHRAALQAQVAAAQPKVAYVDHFVAVSDDAVTFRDAAADLGVKETLLRNALTDAGWIYRKRLGQRYSVQKQCLVDVFEYRAYAEKQHLFVLRPQHNAPRLHNGQVRQTLYLNPAGLNAARALLVDTRQVSDGE